MLEFSTDFQIYILILEIQRHNVRRLIQRKEIQISHGHF